MVLAILAILLALTVPAVNGLSERWLLEKAARRLVSDMRLARQLAISTGEAPRIEFRWEANDYRLILPEGIKKVRLPEGISYALNNFPVVEGVRKLTISALGAPSPAGTVGFKNRRGAKLYVIITPATGRVRLSPDPPQAYIRGTYQLIYFSATAEHYRCCLWNEHDPLSRIFGSIGGGSGRGRAAPS